MAASTSALFCRLSALATRQQDGSPPPRVAEHRSWTAKAIVGLQHLRTGDRTNKDRLFVHRHRHNPTRFQDPVHLIPSPELIRHILAYYNSELSSTHPNECHHLIFSTSSIGKSPLATQKHHILPFPISYRSKNTSFRTFSGLGKVLLP